jgi:hypothetical protein
MEENQSHEARRRAFIRDHHPDRGGDPGAFIAGLHTLDAEREQGNGPLPKVVVVRRRAWLVRKATVVVRRLRSGPRPSRVRLPVRACSVLAVLAPAGVIDRNAPPRTWSRIRADSRPRAKAKPSASWQERQESYFRQFPSAAVIEATHRCRGCLGESDACPRAGDAAALRAIRPVLQARSLGLSPDRAAPLLSSPRGTIWSARSRTAATSPTRSTGARLPRAAGRAPDLTGYGSLINGGKTGNQDQNRSRAIWDIRRWAALGNVIGGGSVDPGIILDLAGRREVPVKQLLDGLQHDSGLLGLSGGRSADTRDLVPAAASGDRDAALALDAFTLAARRASRPRRPAWTASTHWSSPGNRR